MGRVRACSAGRYPRFTPAPVRQPRPSVAQRSGKRRHLRQQEPEMISGGLFARPAQDPVSRSRPAWPGGGRRPGSAFDSHSSRDCQQARRWCSSRLRPGTCRAAPQRPARFPADRRAQNRCQQKPAGGVSPPDPRRGEGRHSARRRRQRRRPAARGARRGPARTTKTHHPTAPRAHHRVLAHTHRLAPYRARGAAPISPTSVNWPFPPSGKGGAD